MKRTTKKDFLILLLFTTMVTLSGCDATSMVSQFIPNNDDALGLDITNNGAIASLPDDEEQTTKTKPPEKVQDNNAIELSDKKAIVTVDAGGRMTPFVPYIERNLTYTAVNFGNLPLPPASGEMDESLSNLITAKVTGILYDSASPSALINVLDTDYLVKQGDKVENFEISKITKDYVAIKTGTNVYRAKVGDIVDGNLYGTGVYNLGHKFAGRKTPAKKEDVLIVKMKKDADTDKKPAANLNDLELPPIPDNLKLPTITVPTNLPAPAGTQ